MEGPRAPEEKEYPLLLQFLNESLRPAQKWTIQEEYPTTLNVQQRSNSRVVMENEQVIAHSILKPLLLKTPTINFKVGAIGSVVTHPSHRGKGLAKRTLVSVMDEACKQSCDIAILWTNLYDYYRNLDFELAASEVSFLISQDLTPAGMGYSFLKTNQVDPQAILKLYTQHTVNSHRTVEDIRLYLKIPQSRIYTAWDQAGAIAAYAIEGKGADLQDHVHEWGGSVPALTSLFGFMFRDRLKPFTVMVPSVSVNLISQLYKNAGNIHEGYLGMIKICRPDLLFPKIEKAAVAVGLRDFSIQQDGEATNLKLGDDVFRVSNSRELVKILFGPWHEESLLPENLEKGLSRLLPLPLWVWGWDSV